MDAIRPDVHDRFRQVVARGVERADREYAEHLASLRPVRRNGEAERRRIQGHVTAPMRRRRP